jgi:hypothetical protein
LGGSFARGGGKTQCGTDSDGTGKKLAAFHLGGFGQVSLPGIWGEFAIQGA